ncbi:Na+/H+ antiporter NhaA [Streptomyces sp. NPDC005438]|uniref:Na+/H+ antiporter NhaA n=1 Tax=Streptomyces sp. NPDC005438 TaxID=3156880 RepID=UPI0033B9A31C
MPTPTPPRKVLDRLPLGERNRVTAALRTETVGGTVLLVAAVVALVLANTPLRDGYFAVRDHVLGPHALHLDLSVATWAKDGLLTLFFFVAGIELKRELVVGELRDPRAAALPVVAALCGMAAPALVYVGVNLAGGGALAGWAVPTATDIAFALAVLAVLGSALPPALRAFLLTLAVVDDLGAILVIAVFFTTGLNLWALLGAALGLLLFWLGPRLGVRGWYVYLPLALVIWGLTHASGIHATVAGVAMGLMLRSRPHEGEDESPADRIEHLARPLSTGVAVPVFALFAAGVAVDGSALREVFTRPETLGVVLGLLLGKVVGVLGGSWLTARFTRAQLAEGVSWWDVLALSTLAGIGFTVSLLIGELAFPTDPVTTEEVKAAVLVGSVLAALCATVLLRFRNAHYRQMDERERRDEDGDGVPDIDQQDDPAFHLRMARQLEERAAHHRRLAEAASPREDPPGPA